MRNVRKGIEKRLSYMPMKMPSSLRLFHTVKLLIFSYNFPAARAGQKISHAR